MEIILFAYFWLLHGPPLNGLDGLSINRGGNEALFKPFLPKRYINLMCLRVKSSHISRERRSYCYIIAFLITFRAECTNAEYTLDIWMVATLLGILVIVF